MLWRVVGAALLLPLVAVPTAEATWGANGSAVISSTTDGRTADFELQSVGSEAHPRGGGGRAIIRAETTVLVAIDCAHGAPDGREWRFDGWGVGSDGAGYHIGVSIAENGSASSVEVWRGAYSSCSIIGPELAWVKGVPDSRFSAGYGGHRVTGQGTIDTGSAAVTVTADLTIELGHGVGALIVEMGGASVHVNVLCASATSPSGHLSDGWFEILGLGDDGAIYEVFIGDTNGWWATTGDTMAVRVSPELRYVSGGCYLDGSDRPTELTSGDFLSRPAPI